MNSSNQIDKSELRGIGRQLRVKELLFDPDVSCWMNQANLTRNKRIYDSLVRRLRLAIESYDETAMRRGDPFMPYCPEALSKSGCLHLLNQNDGVGVYIDPDIFVTGALVIGPTGSGKTFFLIRLCEELLRS